MLYLFDIDGTLLDTGGAGLRALEETNLQLFGGNGPPLDLAGATDLGVISSIMAHFGETVSPAGISAFFSIYHQRLAWNLTHGEFPGRVMPGVTELLENLSRRPGVAMGMLTGNSAEGAALKVAHFGLAKWFSFGAYGCDHADRNLLGPLAARRAREKHGGGFPVETIWIIGDTPKDIACAKALGARCLAVATGRFTTTELENAGADIALPDLTGAAALI